MKETARALYARWTAFLDFCRTPFLFVVRLYWGWSFVETGWGKLSNLRHVTDFFHMLGIPFPQFNAALVGTTETVGGLLLILGLGARIVPVPLLVLLSVAYATSESDALQAIWSDPDMFTSASPFLFALACLIVLFFRAGAWSVDSLMAHRAKRGKLRE